MKLIISKEYFKKIYPGVNISDEKLELILCGITAEIENMSCSDTIEFENDAIEYHVGDDTNRIYLCKPNVIQINSIFVDGMILDPDLYVLKKNCVFLKYGVFALGMDINDYTVDEYSSSSRIEINVDGGYILADDSIPIESDIPCNLAVAISGLIKGLIDQTSDSINLSAYKISDISYNFRNSTEILEPFQKVIKDFFEW